MILADEVIVNNFRAKRDGQSFKALVSRYQDRLYNVAYRLLSNSDEAEEVVQETFLKVLENMGQQHRNMSFTAWLYKIAHNLCIDILRNRQRRSSLAIDSPSAKNIDTYEPRTGTVCQVADPGLDPALKIAASEQENLISQSIEDLPDAQRSVIVLHDIEGFSYMEIAEIIGSSVGTVRSRLYYGRQKLREVLTPYFIDPSTKQCSRW